MIFPVISGLSRLAGVVAKIIRGVDHRYSNFRNWDRPTTGLGQSLDVAVQRKPT